MTIIVFQIKLISHITYSRLDTLGNFSYFNLSICLIYNKLFLKKKNSAIVLIINNTKLCTMYMIDVTKKTENTKLIHYLFYLKSKYLVQIYKL